MDLYTVHVRLCPDGRPPYDVYDMTFAHRLPTLGETIKWYGERYTVNEVDWEIDSENATTHAEPFIIAREALRAGWSHR